MIRRPGADTRLVDGRVVRGDAAAAHETRLDGYKGVELRAPQRSAARLFRLVVVCVWQESHSDRVTGESYWGDLDQRHTLNAYVFYRVSHRFSASAKYRMGSNFPIPGYYTQVGDAYFSAQRNALRLPTHTAASICARTERSRGASAG